jgi:membrane protein DedA with SNARE-associated domain
LVKVPAKSSFLNRACVSAWSSVDAAPATAESTGPSGQSDAAWRPWLGKPRARDLICFFAIAVSGLYAIAMIPLTPALIATHPLLLDMLSGSNTSILAAGSFSAVERKLGLALVIAAALPGMLRFDWVIWWAGRLWGCRVVQKFGNHSPRVGAIAANVERRGTRFAGLAVLLSALMPVSGAPIYAAAGWVGVPLATFMILDAIGSAAWATLLATSGYLLGSHGVAMADLAGRYASGSVGMLVAAIVGPSAWRAWRRMRKRQRDLANRQQGRENGA